MKNQPEILSLQQSLVIGGLQVLSASGELFNHVDQGLPMWAGHGARKVALDIEFLAPFAAPPQVIVGLTGLDNAHDQNLRLLLAPCEITEKGFTIECTTWSDTHIARVSVSWQAVGHSGTVSPPRNARPVASRKTAKPKA